MYFIFYIYLKRSNLYVILGMRIIQLGFWKEKKSYTTCFSIHFYENQFVLFTLGGWIPIDGLNDTELKLYNLIYYKWNYRI